MFYQYPVLHVGLIFMALNWLLFFMEKRHWLKVLKSIIIVAFLLFYAVLTGLSPAVMRSAVMLSLIICGASFRKSHNILNTLSVSAFALLIYDPFMIMNVGFLLSYFAMAGIIIFHPRVYGLYHFKNKFYDHVWSASCAAITAELTTFPLAMLFFHQFPVYFLLSNVIVILFSNSHHVCRHRIISLFILHHILHLPWEGNSILRLSFEFISHQNYSIALFHMERNLHSPLGNHPDLSCSISFLWLLHLWKKILFNNWIIPNDRCFQQSIIP